MANLEVLKSIAGSRPEVTTLKPGESYTQHELKFLFVPIYHRRIYNDPRAEAQVSERFLGILGSGRRVAINPGESTEVRTPFNAIGLEDVQVRREKSKPKTYRYV